MGNAYPESGDKPKRLHVLGYLAGVLVGIGAGVLVAGVLEGLGAFLACMLGLLTAAVVAGVILLLVCYFSGNWEDEMSAVLKKSDVPAPADGAAESVGDIPAPVHSEWDGGVLATIGHGIAAGLLTIITCGIGAPWAICYLMRFVVGHAIVDGKRQRFEGKGLSLLGNCLKWLLLTVITFGIYSFWIPPRLYQWVVKNIHAENGGEETADNDLVLHSSCWDGGVLGTIGHSIVASLLISITCGIATPWAICYLMRYVVAHSVVDGKRLRFVGTGGSLIGHWLLWMLLTVITCGIYGLWVAPKMYQWVVKNIHYA